MEGRDLWGLAVGNLWQALAFRRDLVPGVGCCHWPVPRECHPLPVLPWSTPMTERQWEGGCAGLHMADAEPVCRGQGEATSTVPQASQRPCSLPALDRPVDTKSKGEEPHSF